MSSKSLIAAVANGETFVSRLRLGTCLALGLDSSTTHGTPTVQEEKRTSAVKKGRKRIEGQKEMLLPIQGKKKRKRTASL